MHPLIRAALLLCPKEFREEYEEQIALDAAASRWAGTYNVLTVASSIAWTGILLHVETLARNIGFSVRALAKAPLYAAVAVLAIALAIGANVAVASIIEGVLLKPLPYPHADRLIFISDNVTPGLSYRNALDIMSASTTLSEIGLQAYAGSTLYDGGRPLPLNGHVVNPAFFDMLGVRAERGRLLSAADANTRNVVLADYLWRQRFNSDPHIIGRSLHMIEGTYTVVGVAPPLRIPTPFGYAGSDFWEAPQTASSRFTDRAQRSFGGIARLRDGVSVDAARADTERILLALERSYPTKFDKFSSAQLRPMLDAIVGPTRPLLLLLFAAVSLVLAISCANVANLTLLRLTNREREIAVCSALGASRIRLIWQLATESALLAFVGGVCGIGISVLALKLFAVFGSQILPRWETVSIDGAVLAYALCLVALATVFTAVIPAIAQRRDLARVLQSGRRTGADLRRRRMRAALVSMEVMLAIAVTISAGLVIRSFTALTHVDVGFDTRNAYVLSIFGSRRAERAPLVAVHQVTDALRSIPGVEDVASAIALPFFQDLYFTAPVVLRGITAQGNARVNGVSDDYFATLRIPFVRGRSFDDRESNVPTGAAIVNTQFALANFGTLDVLGKQFSIPQFPTAGPVRKTIVGVVAVTRTSLSDVPTPQVYLSTPQIGYATTFFIRTDGHASGLGRAVDSALNNVDPQIAISTFAPYSALVAQSASQSQAAMLLFVSLAVIALVLAIAGIYAVTSYSVEQRTHEFGVRRAIGAKGEGLLRDVLGQALRQSVVGVAAGITLSAVFSRVLVSILFQTSALDPVTFASVVALLVGCTALAALLPALRATRVDPTTALRYE